MADESNKSNVLEACTNDEQSGAVEAPTGQQNGQAVAPAPAPAARPGFFSIVKTMAIRMVIIYMISSFFRKAISPAKTEEPGGGVLEPSANLFAKDTVMDLYVYVSEQEEFTDFDNDEALYWRHVGLVYGDWTGGPNGDGSYSLNGEISASEAVQANASIYIHVYLVKDGKSPNPKAKGLYSKRGTAHRSMMLNKYKKRKYHNTVNLLTGQTDVDPTMIKKDNMSSFEILSHWHPNLTINILDDHSPWIRGQVPAPLDEYVEFLPGKNKYFPVVYFNTYWNLNNEYMPINETTKTLQLNLDFSPISLFRWQLYAAQSMKSKWNSMLGADFMEDQDQDQDSLKTTFLETNPYLLGMTVIISIVHSVFEFLAFKNDIQFWRNRKSLVGLSVRSVFFNVFQSLIVVLYVLDNETNMVVRISVVIGLVIEIWKIHKVVDITIDYENKWLELIPRVSLKEKSTYTESPTKHFDQLAFKYLSWLLFPLLGGYAVYSVVYQEHKGWYSWVLNMLYGFLLTFGFIMMTPQLFINYKLKSVAHLPWRMLTYKALNTFIDDIFAFVIKMPTLYRIGCFRDDLVFFVYIYQRWIYRVDPKRVNEFGTSAEMMEQKDGASQESITEPLPARAVQGSNTDNPEGDVPKSNEEKKKD